MATETITYEELARRVGDIFLFNKAPELDPEFWYEGIENGSKDYCTKHEECEEDQDDCEYEETEVFQWYLVNSRGADYLTRKTDELVFWSEKLQEYIWGVTHFGTAWSGVDIELKDEEEA